MSGKARKNKGSRLLDIFVVLFCLCGAAVSINLFRLDLFQTLNAKHEPVGTIALKSNIVQRRMSDRMIWDRLAVESLVYVNDLIRTADVSSATLNIKSSSIEIDENTLIRIQRSSEDDDVFFIELGQGNISLNSGEENITLNLMDRQVRLAPRTVLRAETANGGVALRVSEGSALFVNDESGREVRAGSAIVLDSEGGELTGKAAAMLHPLPNARFLNNSMEAFTVHFEWSSLNLDAEENTRLEIAGNRNFTRDLQVIEISDSSADARLDNGHWHWRLLSGDTVLSSGQLSITEASVTELISPVRNSLFVYQNNLPELRFHWTETAEASSYLLEVSQTDDFINPRVRKNIAANSHVESYLEQGNWFWRVMPVFPSVYKGSAAYSLPASFRIEKGDSDGFVIPLSESAAELAMSELTTSSLTTPEPAAQMSAQTRTAPEPSASARSVPQRRASEPARSVPERTTERRAIEPAAVVPPPSLLSAPENRLPAEGHIIGIEELRNSTSITFTWSPVEGANAYIFTLYEASSGERRQIIQRQIDNSTNWTLEDISALDRGTFVWQVEAVNRNASGAIGRRGRAVENSFTIAVPSPGPIHINEPRLLYGN